MMHRTHGRARSIIKVAVLPQLMMALALSSTSHAQQEEPKQASAETGTSPAPVRTGQQPPEKTGEPATPAAAPKDVVPRPEGGPPDVVPPKPSARHELEEPKLEPAIGGYCPVAYQTLGKPTQGKPERQSKYVGEVYYFHSAEAKTKFDENPKKYIPQYSGLCTTALGGMYGNRLWGNPTSFEVVDGKLYLFWNERAKKAYEKDPQLYIEVADERFAVPALDGHCPVAYQTRNKAIKAPPILKVVYKGFVYHLSDQSAYEAFLADPARYAPQYRGY